MRARGLMVLMLAIVTVSVGLAGPDRAADIARAATATVVHVPSRIDASGTNDVASQISAFLEGVPSGSTVLFARNGRYRIEGVVTLLNRSDLVIDGNGSTFFATTDGSTVRWPRSGFRYHWPRRREHWDIRGGGNITLRNLKIRGANPNGGATPDAYVPSLEGQAGIGLSKTTGIVIDSVTITDTYGDFIWVTGNTTDLTVRNSTFQRSGRQGIALVGAQGVVIENNSFADVARSVVDLEPLGRALVQNIHVERNRVGNFRNLLLAAGGGGAGVNDIWLEANHVDGGHGVSVYAGHLVQQRHDYHILDNVGTGAVTPAGTGRPGIIQLLNLDRVEIRGNVQGVADGAAISLDRVCHLTVATNRFPGASNQTLELAPCNAAPIT